MRSNFFISVLALLLCSSCISRPDYVLDEAKMVEILTDVHRSEGLIELNSNTPQVNNEDFKQQIMAAVLVKNGVTRAQYDSSLVWYGQNLESLVKVYNKIQKNLLSEIDHWTEMETHLHREFDLSEAGDSVQLWTVNDYHIFDEKSFATFRSWEISPDSNYVAGDSIIWHVHIPLMPKSHCLVATLSLNYNYHPDSVYKAPIEGTVIARRDTSFSISCVADTSNVFDSLIASLCLLKDSADVDDSIAFVDSLSLIRIHR